MLEQVVRLPMLPRCTFITDFFIRGSNLFIKYSHLKPICINKGPLLKEHANSKKIRFYLKIHTTPNFSSWSQPMWNIYFQMCPTVALNNFSPSLSRAKILLGISGSLSTPVHSLPISKQNFDMHLLLPCISFQRMHVFSPEESHDIF